MLPPDKLRKVDLLTSLLLMVLGGAVVYGALQMPRGGTYGGINNAWYASPGAFPMLVGVLLILCSASVARHAVQEGGGKNLFHFLKVHLLSAGGNKAFQRVTMICVWTGILIFGFMGRMNFYLAGFLFLFAFLLVFHKRREGISYWRHLVTLLTLSLILSSATSFIFDRYLQVPLP